MSSDFPQQQFGPTIKPVPSPQHQHLPKSKISSVLISNPTAPQNDYLNSSLKCEDVRTMNRKQNKSYCPSEKGIGRRDERERKGDKIEQYKNKLMENCSTTNTQINDNSYENKLNNKKIKNKNNNEAISRAQQTKSQQQQNTKQNSSKGLKLMYNKIIGDDDNFYCICQSKDQKQSINQIQQLQGGKDSKINQKISTKKCIVCKGVGFTDGKNNLVKFMEYIMEFKLGNKPAYVNKRVKQMQSTFQKNVQSSMKTESLTIEGQISEKNRMEFQTFKQLNIITNSNKQKQSKSKQKKVVSLSSKSSVFSYKAHSRDKNNNKINDFCVQFIKQSSVEKYEQTHFQQGMLNKNSSEVQVYNLSYNSKFNNSKLVQTKNTIHINQSSDSSNMGFSFTRFNKSVQQANVNTISLGINAMTQSIIDQQENVQYYRKQHSKKQIKSQNHSHISLQNSNQRQKNRTAKQPQKQLRQTFTETHNNYSSISTSNIKKQKSSQINNVPTPQVVREQNQNADTAMNTKSMYLPSKPSLHQSHFWVKNQDPRLSLQPTSSTFKDFNQFKNNLVQNQAHYGYSCDMCKTQPIHGSRFHCQALICKNDYDLCELCYRKFGHKHRMQQIKGNANVQKICENLQLQSSKLIKSSSKICTSNIKKFVGAVSSKLEKEEGSNKKIYHISNKMYKRQQYSYESNESGNSSQQVQQHYKIVFKSSFH